MKYTPAGKPETSMLSILLLTVVDNIVFPVKSVMINRVFGAIPSMVRISFTGFG